MPSSGPTSAVRVEDLERLNQSLESMLDERASNLLQALVNALHVRGSETPTHSRRVGGYTRRLAHELGIRGRELDDIERGATLHDIGNIGVRDAVLLKKGPLDEAEWGEMRRHPTLGYDILAGIAFLARARMIPQHHRERHDGTGYPQRIRANEICVGARVFAVVDTYDAITSDRPYRKCRTYEVARAEIVKCAGSQFDPDVVQAWLRIPQAEWDAIREAVDVPR